MPGVKNHAKNSPESEDSPKEQPPDPIEPYRSAVKSLADSERQLAEMSEVREHLRGEHARAGIDREKCLEEASQLDTDHSEQLQRLSIKAEILSRKIARLDTEIAAAETGLSSQSATLQARFEALQRSYVHWLTEREVGRLREGLGAPAHQNLLETVARCRKPVVEVRNLSMAVPAEREALLSRVAAETGFDVPSYVMPEPAVQLQEELYGPYDEPPGTVAELEKEFVAQNPQGTLPQFQTWIRNTRKDLFKTREQMLALNDPLPRIPDTVGATRIPSEETFSHAR
jgi:hypothetical protein